MLSLVDNWIVFHFVSAYFAFTTVCTPFSLHPNHCILHLLRSPRSFAVRSFLVYSMFGFVWLCILFVALLFSFSSGRCACIFGYLPQINWNYCTIFAATIFCCHCCKVMRKRGDYFLFALFCEYLWQAICELNCGHFDAYADDVSYFLSVISFCSFWPFFVFVAVRPAKIIEWNLIMSYSSQASERALTLLLLDIKSYNAFCVQNRDGAIQT